MKKKPAYQAYTKGQQKTIQKTLDGKNTFNSETDCVVCKPLKNGKTPHRAHHVRCEQNKKTRGGMLSEATMEYNRIIAANIKKNNEPVVFNQRPTAESMSKFFAPKVVALGDIKMGIRPDIMDALNL